MLKTFIALRNIVGTAGVLFAGYLSLESIPALRRYIRIIKMYTRGDAEQRRYSLS